VDQDGAILDTIVRRRRDKQAAKSFFRRLLKGCQHVPRVPITDQPKSHAAARREMLPSVEHRQRRYLNSRAENSHQLTRQRERRMQGFESPGHARRPLGASGPIAQHFRPRRHRFSAPAYRQGMRHRSDPWREITRLHRRLGMTGWGGCVFACRILMWTGNKLTYMDPPPVSRDGRAATRKRADAGIYPASD
jgi:putative transposase